jgi:hypothetical protein
MGTFGPDYDPELDGQRIANQYAAIISLMQDGAWRTLGEIAEAVGAPEASVSAQLRHARKERFGAHTVEKQRRGSGHALWEYRLILNDEPQDVPQQEMF